MERFENDIFKQREEINDRMAEMFELLKKLTASRTSEKVLVREEARHPITKHVNSISIIRMEEEKSVGNNGVVGKNIVEPNRSNVAKTIEEVDRDDEAENKTNKELVMSTEKDLVGEKVRELVETPKSQPVKFYLKHKINKELIEGLVGNPRFNDSLLAMQSGGLKYMDALVDQGSDVNVMPLSTYNRLTNEKLVKTDIRLSLASQSHIYPLGIAEDVLVEIAGFIYHVDFLILDIKEDRKRSFILGTPFLTTAKAEIRIKFHQEKELEFNQWRVKMFNAKNSATTREDVTLKDEGGVT
ncbi:MAK10-like protein [Tanacetum coccineum]|uniref:MAK10-like protein n=1 Tax=Tanacetum coccineum TaxID=301880 RepID=A0ABQ4XRE8_9ASTR